MKIRYRLLQYVQTNLSNTATMRRAMRSERFAQPSLDTLRRPRPAGAAPELGLPRSPPPPQDPTAGSNASIRFYTGNETPITVASVPSSAPSRRATAAEFSVGSLLY